MMRLDHVSFAAGDEGIDSTVERMTSLLGVDSVRGLVHPHFGTTNAVIPLTDHRYIEILEVLDHPSADKAPFGQAVRHRSHMGGGWMGWCISVDDLTPYEHRLRRRSVPGRRRIPNGGEISWKLMGIRGLMTDPQVPYLLSWDEGTEHLHPSTSATPQATLTSIAIAGSPERVTRWLGDPPCDAFDELHVEWIAPSGNPGIMSVTFSTPSGPVTI